jgi:hypothetical protein
MIYTEQELVELKEVIGGITDRIPQDKVSYIWNNYKKISGDKANQPCTCKSSAGLWGKALETIKTYLGGLNE